ncbi:hypothetical protein [Actinoplanes sp. G11-F43]|uniref:hypothetical protein n=1 Tax=Actinoplanes sp. G11-F43 TaxID=3424130 RepID=UPI003D32BC63
MRIRRISAAAVAALTGSTVLVAGPALPAVAATSTKIGVTTLGDVLVDAEHQRVFLSDPGTGKIIATDYDGEQIGSADVAGATDLALTPDSSRLYVNSPAGSAVVALDTTTLDRIGSYSTTGVVPADMTFAGDRIWFSYPGQQSGLGTIDPATGTVRLDVFDTGYLATAELASAAARPGRIAVISTGRTAILDVSGDEITTVASRDGGVEAVDLALSPDGERIAAVTRAGQNIDVRDAADLTDRKLLPVLPHQLTAVDIAADGRIVGATHTVGGPNLHVFAPSGDLIKTFSYPSGRGLEKGVAWEPGTDRLFGVSAAGNVHSLVSYTDTRKSPTTLTLTGPSSVVPGAKAQLSGRLATTLSLPAGTTVAISRGETSLGEATISSTGAFSFTDTPPGDATYRVEYAGDDSHVPSSATATVRVVKASATIMLYGPTTAVPGDQITVTGLLTAQGVPVDVRSVTVTRGATSLGSFPVDGYDFSFTDTPPGEGPVTYRVSYAGGAVTLPTTTEHTVEVSRVVSIVTLAGPSSATRGKALTLTGTLTAPRPLPSGVKVSLTRADLDSPSGKSVGTATVAANGTFKFTDTPPAGSTVTYRVSYAGDATHTAAATTWKVAVSRSTAALTLNNNNKVYDYNKAVSFTARLGSTYKNRTVEIWADPAGSDQPKRLLKRATANSKGDVSASLKLTRNTTVSAVFTGDARYAPRTVSVWVGAKANLSLRGFNNYKTKKIGGTTYRVYKPNRTAYFNNTIANASTRDVRVQLQQYTKGKWKTVDDVWFAADLTLYVEGAGLTGARLRARSGYVKGTSGDSLNSSVWTSYQYFTFSK